LDIGVERQRHGASVALASREAREVKDHVRFGFSQCRRDRSAIHELYAQAACTRRCVALEASVQYGQLRTFDLERSTQVPADEAGGPSDDDACAVEPENPAIYCVTTAGHFFHALWTRAAQRGSTA
jgi:hypothetical protein